MNYEKNTSVLSKVMKKDCVVLGEKRWSSIVRWPIGVQVPLYLAIGVKMVPIATYIKTLVQFAYRGLQMTLDEFYIVVMNFIHNVLIDSRTQDLISVHYVENFLTYHILKFHLKL